MTFEEKLQAVIESYDGLLHKKDQNPDFQSEVRKAHQPLQSQNFQFDRGVLYRCDVPFPDGAELFARAKDQTIDAPDGHINLHYSYKDDCVKSVYMRFWPGLVPAPMVEGQEFWHWRGGDFPQGSVENEGESGLLLAFTDAGKGGYYVDSGPCRQSRVIKLKLWEIGRLYDFIASVEFDADILGEQHLTNFFQHVGYTGLDDQ